MAQHLENPGGTGGPARWTLKRREASAPRATQRVDLVKVARGGSLALPDFSQRFLRQRISYQAVTVRLVVVVASSGSDYHKLLSGLLPSKRHRRGMPTGRNLCHPEFFARAFVKRSEPAVVSRRNENQSTCRDDGSP